MQNGSPPPPLPPNTTRQGTTATRNETATTPPCDVKTRHDDTNKMTTMGRKQGEQHHMKDTSVRCSFTFLLKNTRNMPSWASFSCSAPSPSHTNNALFRVKQRCLFVFAGSLSWPLFSTLLLSLPLPLPLPTYKGSSWAIEAKHLY